MPNKRLLVIIILLTGLSVVLQGLPRILGEVFLFAAMLSGLPIYSAVRLNWFCGLLAYLAAAYLPSLRNTGEALFFLCTNGIIGLSLGITRGFFKDIFIPPIPSTLIVITMLHAVNNLLEISIFGYMPAKAPLEQAFLLFFPIYVYCLIYLKLAVFTDNLLHKYIELDIH